MSTHNSIAAIPLCRGEPPGTEGWAHQEQEYVAADGGIRFIRNITRPTLMLADAYGSASVSCGQYQASGERIM